MVRKKNVSCAVVDHAAAVRRREMASTTLVARLDDWRLRASSWPPHGAEPVPVAELAAFLASVRAELKRLSKSDVAAAWGAWASCMGALARSPHVLVSDAGEQLLACALCVYIINTTQNA